MTWEDEVALGHHAGTSGPARVERTSSVADAKEGPLILLYL
jgi:hypothetical protein